MIIFAVVVSAGINKLFNHHENQNIPEDTRYQREHCYEHERR